MYVLSVQYSCAVVSVFLFGGQANLVLLTLFYSTLLALTHRQKDGRRNNRKKKIQSSVWRVRSCYYDWKKKSSSHLSGGCAIVISTGKKSSSCLSGGCAIVITTGKKVLVLSNPYLTLSNPYLTLANP